MSIFVKPIQEITFEDVECFCNERVRENVRLEYKREFSKKNPAKQITKEIAAMANTQGGLILFGVAEKDRRPELPLYGMPKTKNIDQKVKSFSLDRIYPPLFPEVQLCDLPADPTRIVMVIRVHESDETPHAIEGRTEFYVRDDDMCIPRKATYEEIEWLQSRRKKAVENRERLLQRANSRFATIHGSDPSNYFLTIAVLPLFPSKILVPLGELLEVVSKSQLLYSGGHFPHTSTPYTCHESICFLWADKRIYNELNIFGLLYHKENIGLKMAEEDKDVVDQRYILYRIILVLNFCLNFYKQLGYWGLILIHFSLEGIRGKKLRGLDSLGFPEFWGEAVIDNSFQLNRRVSVQELANQLDEIVLDIYKQFRWSCGRGEEALSEKIVRIHLKNVKKNLRIKAKTT